jgi:hypothetical protein
MDALPVERTSRRGPQGSDRFSERTVVQSSAVSHRQGKVIRTEETGRLQGHDKIEGCPLVKGSYYENEACPSLMMGINPVRNSSRYDLKPAGHYF